MVASTSRRPVEHYSPSRPEAKIGSAVDSIGRYAHEERTPGIYGLVVNFEYRAQNGVLNIPEAMQ